MNTMRQVNLFTSGAAPGRAKLVSGTDVNSNQQFVTLGFTLPLDGLSLEYADKDEPKGLHGSSLVAMQRAAGGWISAPGADALLQVQPASGKCPPTPVLDGHSMIMWGDVGGRKPGAIAQVTAWFDGGVLVEADVVLDRDAHWAVNAPITPDASYQAVEGCYDLQAVVTTQLGHVLGLGSVVSDDDDLNGAETDATMSNRIGYADLAKQTLTPGDILGLLAVAPLR